MIQYNKLVRDKIPDIIRSNGEILLTRILSDEEYLQELDKKLNEEVMEYLESKSLEEVSDILEVIYSIIEARGHSKEELTSAYEKKHNERGGFSDKVYLLSKE